MRKLCDLRADFPAFDLQGIPQAERKQLDIEEGRRDNNVTEYFGSPSHSDDQKNFPKFFKYQNGKTVAMHIHLGITLSMFLLGRWESYFRLMNFHVW